VSWYGPSRAARPLTLLTLALAAVALPWRAAHAECVQAGTTVTCSGADADGFDAGAAQGLGVDVQAGASVDNPAGDALRLNDGNSVDVRTGAALSATGGDGIEVGATSDVRIESGATVSAAGAGAAGIRAGDDGSVTQAGDISLSGTDSVGIVAGSGATITHSGTITATETVPGDGSVDRAAGIRVGSVGNSVTTVAGSTIALDGDDSIGIDAGDTNDLVLHGGTITLGGDRAIGVRVGDDSVPASPHVGHTGTIAISGASGTGIEMGTGNQLELNQAGSIDISGDDGVGIRASAQNRIDLRGTSSISVTGANGIGIRADDANTIESHGDQTISAPGANGIGVLLGADGGSGNSFTNRFIVEGRAAGVSFAPSGIGADNTLTNRRDGVIRTRDGTGAFTPGSGMAILGSAGVDVVENNGAIWGTTDLAGGDDRFQLGTGGVLLGADGTGAGLVEGGAGSDTFIGVSTATGQGTLPFDRLSGFEAGDIQSGVWDVTTSGGFSAGLSIGDGSVRLLQDVVLSADVNVAASAIGAGGLRFDEPSTLNGNLTVDTGFASVLAPATIAGNVDVNAGGEFVVLDAATIGGNLVQAAESSLYIELDPTTADGHVAVAGTMTIESANPASDSDPATELTVVEVTPLPAGTLELVSATGVITGTFDRVTLPTGSGVLAFSLIEGLDAISLVVTRSSFTTGATTANQRAVAAALDGALPGASGDLAALLVEIDAASAAGTLATALDALHPEAYDAHTSRALALGDAVADAVLRDRPRCDRHYPFRVGHRRLEQPRPCNDRGRGGWVQALGALSRRSGEPGHIDYDATGWGALLGLDQSVGTWLLSAFAGSGGDRIDVDRVGRGTLYTLEAGVAARRAFGGTRIGALAGYGLGFHDQRRHIATGGTRVAEGDYTSHRLTLRGELEQVFEPRPGLEVAPRARTTFSYLRAAAFSESGAGAANLRVDALSHPLLSTALGGRIAYEGLWYRWINQYLTWAEGVWSAELSADWVRTWTGARRDLGARLSGAAPGSGAFRIGASDARQVAQVGAQLRFQPLHTRTVVGLGYGLQIGDGTTVHRGTAEVRLPF